MNEENKNFREIFEELNEFLMAENKEADQMGGPFVKKQTVKIVGQAALLLADLPFPVEGTSDLDVVSSIDHVAQKKLIELLLKKGMSLDTDSHLIWMPKDTRFKKIFDFPKVEVFVAEPEDVLLSKYKFNRPQDRDLFKDYLKFFPEFEKKMKQEKK